MSIPKLHHYVPQFYLKRFADANGHFYVWNKTTKNIFKSTPTGVAAEKYFYRVPEFIGTEVDPQFLEKDLAVLEGISAEITQGWINILDDMQVLDKITISPDDRWQIATFISVQCLRTAEQRGILASFASENDSYKSGISPDEKINLHAYMLCRRGLVEDISKWIEQSIWIFARNTTGTPFWTSDNPVSFKTSDNRMWLKGPGIMSIGSYVVFPLTPSYILYCHEPTHWSMLKKIDCCISPVAMTADMVEHENSGQVFNATRFVISSSNDFRYADEFVETIGTDIYSPYNDKES